MQGNADSGFQKIWNLGLWNPKYSFRNPDLTNVWNPESNAIQYNAESKTLLDSITWGETFQHLKP